MRTIAIINQKGGCGKTTTAINLSAVLAEMGKRTLLVDLDPQAHCAAGLAVPPASIEYDIGDAMLKVGGDEAGPAKIDPDKLLWRVSRNLDLAPSRTKLAALEAVRGGLASAPAREQRLRRVLDVIRDEALNDSESGAFDFAVIDCPPSIGLLTYNAIAAADEILIPVETSFFSLQGATKQAATIQSLGRRLGTRPATRLLATIHDPSHALAQDLREELGKRFGDAVIPISIRQDTRVREASSYGQSVIEYAADSDGAADYRALGAWLTGDAAEPVDEATIEVKPTELPLGARRRTARPLGKPGTPGRAAPATTPTATQSTESQTDTENPAVSTGAAASAAATKAVPAAPPAGAEPKPDGDAVETLSRVEDLVRRAAALNEKARAATPAGPSRLQTRLRSSTGAVRLVEEAHDADRRTKSVARLFGARRHGDRIVFVQPIELGLDVRIAGDFNNWSATATPMRRNEALGVHEMTLDSVPGRLCYRLVVDGRWVEDQFNPRSELNEFGERNSIIEAD
jgi:chromosome partitioning protein